VSGSVFKAGGQGGVQVVIQHPPSRGDAVCLVVSGSQGAGMFAEQIVQLVPAEGGLADQVLVIQLIEVAHQSGVMTDRRQHALTGQL
jgi:hypothetical protein